MGTPKTNIQSKSGEIQQIFSEFYAKLDEIDRKFSGRYHQPADKAPNHSDETDTKSSSRHHQPANEAPNDSDEIDTKSSGRHHQPVDEAPNDSIEDKFEKLADLIMEKQQDDIETLEEV